MSPSLIVLLVVLGVFFAYFIVKLVILDIKGRKHDRELLEQMEEPLELPPAKAVGARVILKSEGIEKWGNSHSSSHRIVYEMTFDTDDREVLTFEVGPDTYYRYNELDYATLVTVDGKFFHFGEGEEVREEECL